ncbi:DnaJ domain-containing protein [Marinobacteraceae bacterium S3BR75-40.1]
MTGPTPVSQREKDTCDRLMAQWERAEHHGPRLLSEDGLGRVGRTFLMRALGYVAKADGAVQKTDIRYAESLMRSLAVSPRERKRLIAAFREGKTLKSPKLSSLARWWLTLPQAVRIVIALAQVCQTDSGPSPARVSRCEHAGMAMGLSRRSVAHVLDSYRTKVWNETDNNTGTLNFVQACRLLGCEPDDSLAQLKKAYRRQMREYHPDKRQHLRVSPATEAAARDRLHRLQQAWERVRREHG